VFARKPIFGYMSMVAALFGIVFLSMTVWAHHMFTVGMNTYVEGFFMLMTMLIAVPTGIKFFNWMATAWWGSIDFSVPMKFVFGFLATFLIGGITGVYLASVPVDTQLHQSYYVVAHLHYVLFGGSVFTDRKSTRLNSSHGSISYAVFCLKKKKENEQLSTC